MRLALDKKPARYNSASVTARSIKKGRRTNCIGFFYVLLRSL